MSSIANFASFYFYLTSCAGFASYVSLAGYVNFSSIASYVNFAGYASTAVECCYYASFANSASFVEYASTAINYCYYASYVSFVACGSPAIMLVLLEDAVRYCKRNILSYYRCNRKQFPKQTQTEPNKNGAVKFPILIGQMARFRLSSASADVSIVTDDCTADAEFLFI